MKKFLLFCSFILICPNAFAAITAEKAYDIARMEMFPTDFNRKMECTIYRNETPVNFDKRTFPQDLVKIANKVKGKEYWAVDFVLHGKIFLFIVDSNNGKIIASYPSHEDTRIQLSSATGLRL